MPDLREQEGQRSASHAEGEFYAEPAKLTRKDVAGVLLALVALMAIGVSGYVWLNPKLSLSNLVGSANRSAAQRPGDADKDASPASSAAPGMVDSKTAAPQGAPVDLAPDILAAANGERQAECPQCGMVAGASEAEVVAKFADGSIHHFDSWICAFGWSDAQSQPISDAIVMAEGSTPQTPRWISAQRAVFLYDTKRIRMSMPPYVAAFSGETAAQSGQAELGGQLVSWTELQAKFEK